MPFSIKPRSKSPAQCINDALDVRAVAKGRRKKGGRPLSSASRCTEPQSVTGDDSRNQAAFDDSSLSENRTDVLDSEESGKPAIRRKMRAWDRFVLRFWMYFYKMRGKNPVTYDFSLAETAWSFIGAFISMVCLAFINIELWGREEQGLLLGSFGASAMLVFGAPHAPFAQPRNVVGGHVVSAFCGVFVQLHLGAEPWFASALAVALAVSAMHVTATLHPPGGATALIAVVGSPELKEFGYTYALYPVGVSVAAMVLVGILYNNLSKSRRYPVYWW